MGQSLSEAISAALSAAREGAQTRENALVTTKLQEAMHWHNADQLAKQDAARRAGFNIGQPVQPPPVTTPEQSDGSLSS